MQIQIQVSIPDKEVGGKLKDSLLQNKFAACLQVFGPIESHYWWEGKIEASQEYLCLIKTLESHYQAVEEIILEIHPYEVPEIIVSSITQGYKAYLQWIEEAVKS